jgi:hypothetical protein
VTCLRHHARALTRCRINWLRTGSRRGHIGCSTGGYRRKEPLIGTLLKMRHESIADAIERYLQRHPAAADSEVGIAEWWLGEQGIRVSVDDVREALKLLESRGVMENVILHDGRRLWRPTRRPGV